jgi:hypothetical protein
MVRIVLDFMARRTSEILISAMQDGTLLLD